MPSNRFTLFLGREKAMSWSLLDQLLVSAANFAIGIMVARYAGIAEFGKFTLVLVLLLYVAIVLDMILAMPMMTLAGARQHRSAAYFAAITAWNIILAVGVGAVVAALTCTLFWLRDGTVPWLLVFAAFAVTAAHNQLHIVRRTLFALDRGRSALIVGVLRYFLLFAAAAVLYFQGANTNAETALLLLAGSAFVTSIIPTVKLLRGGVRLRMMRAIWSRQWPMARWMLLMAAVSTGQEQLIWVMVSVMLGDAAVGGMRAAQHLLGTTHFVLNGMQNFVARQSAQAYRQSGAEGLMAYLIGRTWLLGAMMAGIILAIVTPAEFWLTLLYGQDYAAGSWMLRLFGVIYMVVFVRELWAFYLRTIDRTDTIFKAFAVSSACAAVAAYPAIAGFGVYGALIVVLSAHALSMALVLVIVGRFDRALSLRPAAESAAHSEPGTAQT